MTGDPWDGRTLEWSTSSPPPPYNFAFTPIVHDLDAWYDMKKRGYARPTRPASANPHAAQYRRGRRSCRRSAWCWASRWSGTSGGSRRLSFVACSSSRSGTPSTTTAITSFRPRKSCSLKA